MQMNTRLGRIMYGISLVVSVGMLVVVWAVLQPGVVFSVFFTLFVIGIAVQWVIERFEVDEFNSLLLTFGLFIITIRLVTNVWSADFKRIGDDHNRYASEAFFIGDIGFAVPLLMAIAAACSLVWSPRMP